MSNCSNSLPNQLDSGCATTTKDAFDFDFDDSSVYRNGNYYGDIICVKKTDQNYEVKYKVNCGNIYADGHIRTVYLYPANL